MGQRYDHQSNLQRPTFLPTLCSRPSIKNVTVPKSQDSSSSLSFHEDHDPLSPKISCIGQVKRHNKIIGFPTTTTHNHKLAMVSTKNHPQYCRTTYHIPYFKLKKFFSSKSLTTTAAASATTVMLEKTDDISTSSSGGGQRSRRGRRGGGGRGELVKKKGSKIDERSEKGVVINIVDLDPPLPVIKKKQEGGEKTENLWKRRSGGLELGSLQLQRIQPNLKHQMQPTTV